ncbi:MAG TPA: hypothetical protein VJ579_02730 [Candidatus Paceibacterota bacterium]|nr:hypothetical protein [Candidatus Paceibacterota bacterium]
MKKNNEVIVRDLMQNGYRYVRTAPVGKQFDKEFKPDLSPREMLALGIFGGRYMRDCVNEFPKSWFMRARLHPIGVPGNSPSLNYFGVRASQELVEWRKKGWINEQHDPRGWFQWYCRYYMGRRIPDEDALQIKRWKAMRRHLAQIAQNCRVGDLGCRKRQRQALLHWAYDSRKI